MAQVTTLAAETRENAGNSSAEMIIAAPVPSKMRPGFRRGKDPGQASMQSGRLYSDLLFSFLRFRALGQRHRKHALLEARLDLVAVDALGH